MDIKSALSQAFDEGIESPYELKDAVIDRLVKAVDKKTINTQQFEYGASFWIQDHINPVVKKILQITDCCVAGGYVLKTLVCPIGPANLWRGDVDVFVHKRNIDKLAAKYFLGSITNNYNDDKIEGIYHIKDKTVGWVQVIVHRYQSNMDLIKSFDLSVCQAAYSIYNQPRFEFTPEFMDSYLKKTIKLNPNIQQTATTVDRIVKYIKRGFADQTSIHANSFNIE